MDEVADLFSFHSIRLELSDQRFPGKRIEVEFRGSLRPLQQLAADEISKHDTGILCATTAFGKTVVGAWLIAARKVNTLILVHRRQLLDQWRERLAGFLSVPVQSIGQIGGGKAWRTGIIECKASTAKARSRTWWLDMDR